MKKSDYIHWLLAWKALVTTVQRVIIVRSLVSPFFLAFVCPALPSGRLCEESLLQTVSVPQWPSSSLPSTQPGDHTAHALWGGWNQPQKVAPRFLFCFVLKHWICNYVSLKAVYEQHAAACKHIGLFSLHGWVERSTFARGAAHSAGAPQGRAHQPWKHF